MSKSINNPLLFLSGLRGLFGDTIVLRQTKGKLIVSAKPKMRKSHSPKQQANIDRFREARIYAGQATSTPEGKAEYAARITNRKHTAFLVAIADYLNKPQIHQVDTSSYHGAVGDLILVDAFDDFMVARVTVTIIVNNIELEQGDAHLDEVGVWWRYAATMVNTNIKDSVVKVQVWDKPGNVVSGIVAPS